ncbi:MAG: DUF6797 domain-containing protein, partial [Limisphaerales bacterium]
MKFRPIVIGTICTLLFAVTGFSQPQSPKSAEPGTWAEFVEPDFPFISSVLDARKLGPGWPTNNLTPRGLILNLGNDCWVCFDVDLLRISTIWQGKGITPAGMAQGSYQVAGAKAPEGQGKLPLINGIPWMVNGIYPGWQPGGQIRRVDPRESGPDPREVGRGALDPAIGRFKAVRLLQKGVSLEYEVHGVAVREWIESRVVEGERQVQRSIEVGPRKEMMTLLLGMRPDSLTNQIETAFGANRIDGKPIAELDREAETWFVRVFPSPGSVRFTTAMALGSEPETWDRMAQVAPTNRWPGAAITQGVLSTREDAYVMDHISVPTDNPWKRNVRFADITFFKTGEAAAVTFDGDVWLISGLKDDLKEVTWRRFASGLHEPLSISVRDEELFVFDRNGIWKLVDTDGNGEADLHELVSNNFSQTAETREYANGMRIAPDGSFIIAKGGQQGTTLGKHNGTVLRISRDGKTTTQLGWGLRQPFIGVNPKNGLVTASDQQGHYTPATPLHIIENNQYYGYLAGFQPKEQYPAPITDPLTWIPHSINPSGAGQVWLYEARMGSLNDRLIHIGYYRPELFAVLLNERGSRKQAAVVSLTRDFEFPPFCGAVNPVDGQLYVI